MSGDLFERFERLETCGRVEVTVENLHILAQHFGGHAVYEMRLSGPWWERKPHLIIPDRPPIEIGAWVAEDGQRWNPEPLTQGWERTVTPSSAHE